MKLIIECDSKDIFCVLSGMWEKGCQLEVRWGKVRAGDFSGKKKKCNNDIMAQSGAIIGSEITVRSKAASAKSHQRCILASKNVRREKDLLLGL